MSSKAGGAAETGGRFLDQVSRGAVFPGGHIEAKTGTWRVFRPVIDQERCNMCLLCWVFCPDGVVFRQGAGLGIDYEYCKGCGICANECRPKAIEMVKE